MACTYAVNELDHAQSTIEPLDVHQFFEMHEVRKYALIPISNVPCKLFIRCIAHLLQSLNLRPSVQSCTCMVCINLALQLWQFRLEDTV